MKFTPLLRFIALFVIVYTIIATSAHATNPASNTLGKTSAATLVASALESAGYKAQEIILGETDKGFGKELKALAALIFVIAAVRLVFMIVLDGQYLPALWMVMGPALFFVLITRTTEGGKPVSADAVDWQFAGVKQQNKVDDILKNTPKTELRTASGQSNVSWFFHEYNRLVSVVIRDLIKVFTDTAVEDHFIFQNRFKLFRNMLAQSIINNDPELSLAVNEGISQCAEQMDVARTIAMLKRGNKDGRNDAVIQAAQNRYAELVEEDKGRNVNITAQTYRFYSNLLQKIKNKNKYPAYNSDSYKRLDIKDNLLGFEKAKNNAFANSSVYSAIEGGKADPSSIFLNCGQSWVLMGIAIADTVVETMYKTDKNNIPEGTEEKYIRKVYESIVRKLKGTPTYGNTNAQEDLSQIPVMIGGYMLRNYMILHGKSLQGNNNLTRNLGMHHLPSRHAVMDENGLNMDMHYVNVAWKEKTYAQKRDTLYAYTMSIPYLQGVFLYVLSLTYPFFALIVIFPGRANFFFTWMALWAWVKSWDVGWAAIMVLDRTLWEMMPHSSVFNQIDDPEHAPITMMESAFMGDYAYSQDMYMSLIAFLLMSVPILMGRLILAGKGAGWTAITGDLEKKFAGVIGKGTGDMKSNELALRAQFHTQMVLAQEYQNVFSNLGDHYTNKINNAVGELVKNNWDGRDESFQKILGKAGMLSGNGEIVSLEEANEFSVLGGMDQTAVNLLNTRYTDIIKRSAKGREQLQAGQFKLALLPEFIAGGDISGGMQNLRDASELKIKTLNSMKKIAKWRAYNSSAYQRAEGFRSAMSYRNEAFSGASMISGELINATLDATDGSSNTQGREQAGAVGVIKEALDKAMGRR